MSTVRTRTRARGPARHRGAAAARWRVAGRLARRQVVRTKLSSLLIVALVALPIAGMSGFAVWASSAVATPDEKVRVELGGMQAWVAPAGPAGAGLWQLPDDPEWIGYPVDPAGVSVLPSEPAAADPLAALPAGTESIELIENGTVRVDTAAGSAAVRAWFGPAWDDRFAGRFDLVAGEPPSSASEALVTPATLERIGVPIGGALTLTASGETFTIVGTMNAAGFAERDAGVFLPLDDTLRESATGAQRWYLPDTELSWPDVEALNDSGIVALSRSVLLDPPAVVSEEVRQAQQNQAASFWGTVSVIAIGGAFAAYVVVMLAGAAFAVAARRQQRSLAVAASVGAGRHDLFRTILLQGTALGAAGGVIGVALGVGAAAAVLAATDDGSGTRPWGLHVPWWGLALIAVFAVVVGTLSALAPARGVARTDAISALRGARRPQRPTAARPIWGSALLIAGVAITILCAVALAALATSSLSYDSPLRWLPVWGFILGPIVAQVGILLSGRWLLWTTSRVLSRVGTAARLASRDAAANAARTVPAFAAIGATVFLGVFVTAASAMSTANTTRSWYYSAPVGSVSVNVWSSQATPSLASLRAVGDAVADEGTELLKESGAQDTAVIAQQPSPSWAMTAEAIPDDAVLGVARMPEKFLLGPDESFSMTGGFGYDPGNNLSVIAPGDLETALGAPLSAAQLADYRDGAAIVTDARYVVDGRIDIAVYPAVAVWRGETPNNLFRPADDARTVDPVRSEGVDAIALDLPPQTVAVAIAPERAAELGLEALPQRVIGTFSEPLSTDDLDRMYALAEARSTAEATLSPYLETGPPSADRWLVPLLAVVSVLVIGASSVALGLARFERRPDDATLSAVGGTRALRRRIGFWQGLLIAGFGTLAGAVTGLLPAIGLSIQSPETQRLADVPWPVLAALAVGLPLVIAAVNALVPPRRPDLTRRNAIT